MRAVVASAANVVRQQPLGQRTTAPLSAAWRAAATLPPRRGGSGPTEVSSSSRLRSERVSGGEGADDAGSSVAVWWKRQRERESGGSRAVVDPEYVSRLSLELEALAAELTPSERHNTERDAFMKKFQTHLSEILDGAEVAAFGSVVNGFWTTQSDVDVCVRVKGATTRNAQINVLRKIAGELTRVTTHHVEPRFGAQVPILHWAPKRPGMVACDISVNNVLAVANSRLLGNYVRLDDRLRVLGLCLKIWLAARGINDRSRGTLSSFALVLMLVHFLQRRTPPRLPSLQDIALSRNQAPLFVAGVDCRYCTDAEEIEREMKYLRGGKPPNQESVGQLMLEFLRYFGHDYKHGIIRIRDTRSFLPPRDEKSAFLVVDNPFEAGKDVANIDESQHALMRKEFRRAQSLLSSGRSFREMLAATPDAGPSPIDGRQNHARGPRSKAHLSWADAQR